MRRRALVLVITALVLAGCVLLSARLRLVTDLAELLPARDPAVVATHEAQARLGGVAPLQVAIEGADRAKNLELARTLRDELAKLPEVERAAFDVRAERAFFAKHRWLYLERAELELVRDRLNKELGRKNPLLVDLEDEGPTLAELEQRFRDKARVADRYPEGYFMSPDGTLVVIMIWPTEATFREHAGEGVVARVSDAVRAHPVLGVKVSLAGSIYEGIVERHALESDLAWTSIACIVLVGLAVALFFGRLRAIPLMAAPALIGVAIAFAAGELAFGQLNASTAFLGSIILGGGINTAIIQLARYDEERRAGLARDEALVRSVTTTIRGTAVAALAAAIAYGSLTLTDFRGFSQFGVIGAVGMVASWLATILVLPALVATFDRSDVPRRRVAFGAPFARIAGRSPLAVTLVGLALTGAAVAVVVPYVGDPFEYNLRRLRRVQSAERQALERRIVQIFRTFTPTILIAERPEQAAEIAKIVRARDPSGSTVGEIVTIETLLPGSPAEQRAKLEIIDEIRGMIDRAADERLTVWRPEVLTTLGVDDLPPTAVRSFRDLRGELVPIVVVYRAEGRSYWNGRDLLKIAETVGRVELRDGTVVHAGGNAVVFGGMIRSIVRDGPRATIASLLGVALLVIFLARGVRGAIVVVAALLVGVTWMLGAAALAGVRVNFLDFIALPLTFGIGAEYATNLYMRQRLDGRVIEALRATGGAIALCSLTTTIGYASLLFADSQGLRSFGALAILGELACVIVALVVMPAWLCLLRRDPPP